MPEKKVGHFAILLTLFLLSCPISLAKTYKVLIVMSYEKDNPWCHEIKEGIEAALGKACHTTYTYMDTKVDLTNGHKKAAKAFELFKKIKPDGVIAADDNAQSMFVLPYLKDKVKIPIIFCGVNAKAEKYGYPTENISGCEERGHLRETIAFARQLVPELKSVAFVSKKSPSGDALRLQVKEEQKNFGLPVSLFLLAQSTTDVLAEKSRLSKCSAIFVLSVEGLLDENGHTMAHREVAAFVQKHTGKIILGANRYHITNGALCAVVKTGNEQGHSAGDILLEALRGTPIEKLPVTRNFRGRRYINVSTMKQFGIKPNPYAFLGAKLLRTMER